jgi:hypothetical protein
MGAMLMAMSLMLATPSPSPAIVSPQLLVGEWHSDYGSTYHFRADGTWERYYADMLDGGRWKLCGDHQLELIYVDEHNRISHSSRHEVVAIDRVVHETLYVRTHDAREVWLKQPGPNQTMKPTAPDRMIATNLATTPCRGLSLSR